MSLFGLQVVIFVKSVQRCVALSQLLVEQNFPAIAIHRGMAQEERSVCSPEGGGRGNNNIFGFKPSVSPLGSY